MTAIIDIVGREILDSRGNPTVEVDVMLEKTSPGIMFAVIGFGGFLGIGEKYHAIPWSTLDYEKSRGGYVVPFTEEQLKAAPAHTINELTGEDGTKARDDSYEYWKVTPYWY